MERRIVCGVLVVLLGMLETGWTQSAVSFQNDNLNGNNRRVRFSSGQPVRGATFVAQLYYGPAGTPAANLTPLTDTPVPFYAKANNGHGGYWQGAMRSLPGFSAGQTVVLQVRVWDGSLAPTYEQAAVMNVGEHGVSAPFSYTIPSNGSGGNAYAMANFQGFTLSMGTLPGGPVILSIALSGNSTTVSWPSSVAGYLLQQNADLTTTNWTDVVDAPVVVGTNYQMTFTASGPQQFFRLRYP